MLPLRPPTSRETAWLEISAVLGAGVALSLSMYLLERRVNAGTGAVETAFGAFVIAVIVGHDSRGKRWFIAAVVSLLVGLIFLVVAVALVAFEVAGL